ncbi:hypothetical protein OYC64_000034 [Pagothenia borchgrevinki]|uniref:Uncharacterized protein n=1 Tax=Pagothenia borchgrevinki TaxID=8213 RepID=A0ABD2HEX5_PAGBO
MEREMGRRIGAAGAVLQSLYRTVVTKRELSQKAKLSVYRAISVPTLTYGHEGWVMTERTRSRIQAAEIGEVFQARPAGKRPRGRPRTRWRDYISWLAWERLGIPQSELVDVARERNVWGSLLELIPPRPDHG